MAPAPAYPPSDIEEDAEEQASGLMKAKLARSPKSALQASVEDDDDEDSYDVRPPPFVVDNGSCFIKGGLASDSVPKCFFENAVGVDSQNRFMDYVGLYEPSGAMVADAYYGMHRGRVHDWDIVCRTWDILLNKEIVDGRASVAGQHRPYPDVLMTHGLQEPEHDREEACEILFEVVRCNSTSSVSATNATLTYAGLSSGVAVDLGDGSVQVEHLVDGASHFQARLDFGGMDLTKAIHNYLRFDRGVRSLESIPLGTLSRRLKEQHCMVRLPNERNGTRMTYRSDTHRIQLPDGSFFEIPGGMFSDVAESAFDPHSCTISGAGDKRKQNQSISLPGLVAAALSEASQLERSFAEDFGLKHKVVVTGGTSMMKNFCQRFEQELHTRVPDGPESVDLVLPEDRDIACWKGACILASQGTSSWLRRTAYEECGPSAVHRHLVTA